MCDYNEISTNIHIFYCLGYRYFNNGTYLTDNVTQTGWYFPKNEKEEFELLCSKHEQLKWKITDEILTAITNWIFDNSQFCVSKLASTCNVKDGEGTVLFSGVGNCQLYECLKFIFKETSLNNESIKNQSGFSDNWIRQFGD
jgi:hypothetical protein